MIDTGNDLQGSPKLPKRATPTAGGSSIYRYQNIEGGGGRENDQTQHCARHVELPVVGIG